MQLWAKQRKRATVLSGIPTELGEFNLDGTKAAQYTAKEFICNLEGQ